MAPTLTPPFITASVGLWMRSCSNEDDTPLPPLPPHAAGEEVPSPALPQNYICSFAYFGIFSSCRNKDMVQWREWHGPLVPTTGTTYFVRILLDWKTWDPPALGAAQGVVLRGRQSAALGTRWYSVRQHPKLNKVPIFGISFQQLFCIDCITIYPPLGVVVLSLIFSCQGAVQKTWPPAVPAPEVRPPRETGSWRLQLLCEVQGSQPPCLRSSFLADTLTRGLGHWAWLIWQSGPCPTSVFYSVIAVCAGRAERPLSPHPVTSLIYCPFASGHCCPFLPWHRASPASCQESF